MPAPPGTDPDSPAALVELARAVAVDAARLLTEASSRPDLAVAIKSTDTDLVTEIDHAAERLIVDRLREARPDDGLLGEEGSVEAGRSGVRWVIDPIDGTTNFVYRHPGYCVSVAAQRDGATVAGVVVDPVHHDVFEATLGGGARRNGRPVAASARRDLARALAATGFSYAAERRAAQAAVLTVVLPAVRDIRRMGSAALDLCSVACGRVDLFYESGLQPWDHAAGALIAAEAGALVTGLDGRPYRAGLLVAAPEALHGPLLTLLGEAGAADIDW